MTQALLPHFRARKTGNFVFISSIYGLVSNMAGISYSATKFALESLHEGLIQEGAPFGIRSFSFEPGFCRTEITKPSDAEVSKKNRNVVEELAPLRSFMNTVQDAIVGNQVGDPKKVVKIMVDIVRGEGVAEGKEVPDRLPLGSDALVAIQPKHENMLKQWEEWNDVILSTDCDDVKEQGDPEYVKMLKSVE